MNPYAETKPDSLLSIHELLMTRTNGDRIGDYSCQIEQARIEALTLDSLTLPDLARSHGSRSMDRRWLALSFLAASLIGIVIYERHPENFSTKGEQGAFVYVSHNGKIQKWEPGTLLTNGDRVQAEILANERIAVFWGMLNREGRLMSDANSVLGSRLDLAPGSRATFKHSFELQDTNDGETLAILFCSPADALKSSSNIVIEIEQGGSCSRRIYRLR